MIVARDRLEIIGYGGAIGLRRVIEVRHLHELGALGVLLEIFERDNKVVEGLLEIGVEMDHVDRRDVAVTAGLLWS